MEKVIYEYSCKSCLKANVCKFKEGYITDVKKIKMDENYCIVSQVDIRCKEYILNNTILNRSEK